MENYHDIIITTVNPSEFYEHADLKKPENIPERKYYTLADIRYINDKIDEDIKIIEDILDNMTDKDRSTEYANYLVSILAVYICCKNKNINKIKSMKLYDKYLKLDMTNFKSQHEIKTEEPNFVKNDGTKISTIEILKKFDLF